MEKQRGFAGGGWAFEGLAGDADDGRAAFEASDDVTQGEGSGDGVELVAAFDEAGSRGGVEVCAEGDDEEVGFEVAGVSNDGADGGVEGTDSGLEDADAGFDEVAVKMTDLGGGLMAEHHFEFGEAEDEGVGLVDEDDVDGVAEGFGEDGGEFEAAEAGTEDYYAGFHRGKDITSSCWGADFRGRFRGVLWHAGQKCGGSYPFDFAQGQNDKR